VSRTNPLSQKQVEGHANLLKLIDWMLPFVLHMLDRAVLSIREKKSKVSRRKKGDENGKFLDRFNEVK
jgi:hypothetical protein